MAEDERMREQELNRDTRERSKDERMKRKEALKLQATEREPNKGWPPSLSISPIVHLMEYYVPRRGFHVGPHILIKAAAWSTVVPADL